MIKRTVTHLILYPKKECVWHMSMNSNSLVRENQNDQNNCNGSNASFTLSLMIRKHAIQQPFAYSLSIKVGNNLLIRYAHNMQGVER